MDIRSINTGSSANDGTGESIRAAFTKVNNNFDVIERVLKSYNYQTPNTGFDIEIEDNTSTLLLQPGATLASGTITMPATPYDGQIQRICTTQTITSLSIEANTSHSILNDPSTLVAGTGIGFIYRSTNNTWYRLY